MYEYYYYITFVGPGYPSPKPAGQSHAPPHHRQRISQRLSARLRDVRPKIFGITASTPLRRGVCCDIDDPSQAGPGILMESVSSLSAPPFLDRLTRPCFHDSNTLLDRLVLCLVRRMPTAVAGGKRIPLSGRWNRKNGSLKENRFVMRQRGEKNVPERLMPTAAPSAVSYLHPVLLFSRDPTQHIPCMTVRSNMPTYITTS